MIRTVRVDAVTVHVTVAPVDQSVALHSYVVDVDMILASLSDGMIIVNALSEVKSFEITKLNKKLVALPVFSPSLLVFSVSLVTVTLESEPNVVAAYVSPLVTPSML